MVVFLQQIHIKGRLGVQERALPAQQDGEADDGNGMSRAVAHRDIRRLVRRNGGAKRLHSAKVIQNAPAHLAGAGLAGEGILFTAVRSNHAALKRRFLVLARAGERGDSHIIGGGILRLQVVAADPPAQVLRRVERRAWSPAGR